MTPQQIFRAASRPSNRTAAAILRVATIGCAAALLTACDGDDSLATTPGRAPQGAIDDAHDAPLAWPMNATQDTTPPLATELPVCKTGRAVAVVTEGECPPTVPGQSGHWLGAALFTGASADALRGFCSYTWAPETQGAPADLAAFNISHHFSAADSDCDVVWPQDDELSDALAGPLRTAFYKHVGRVDAALAPTAATTPVVIALPDTASDAHVEMNSEHGTNMAGIITSIACPAAGSCHAEVDTRLALPLVDGVPDPVHGGFYGSQAQLAQAIHDAVAAWALRVDGARLVINLSVGWEPGKFGGATALAAMPVPVQAVYRALQYARCHGAVIIAAAGNKVSEECIAGPLAPALWEEDAGPTRAVCIANFAVPGAWQPATQPLVHAVGGVAHDNGPLQSERPGGRPRLVAPGYVAVADGAQGPTGALTGSSVAAATVSGIAGLIWSYNHALDPGQVIARIRNGGALMPGVQADFGVGGTVARVSACRALAHSCSGARCPKAVCPDTVVDVAALADAAADAVEIVNGTASPIPLNRTTLAPAAVCPAGCDEAELFTAGDGPMDVAANCALDRTGERDRYTNPQPSFPACSVCFLSAGTVNMTVVEEYSSIAITSALLEVTNGANTQTFRLGSLGVVSSREVTKVALPGTLMSPVQRATLHLTFATGETQSNAISVY